VTLRRKASPVAALARLVSVPALGSTSKIASFTMGGVGRSDEVTGDGFELGKLDIAVGLSTEVGLQTHSTAIKCLITTNLSM